jgi:hypothetical protein
MWSLWTASLKSNFSIWPQNQNCAGLLAKKIPTNDIKSLRNIKLKKQTQLLCSMQGPEEVLCIQKIVLNAATLYERALGTRNQIIKLHR